MKPSLKKLRKIKEKVKEMYLGKDDNVNGIGIGDGCVYIYLVKKTDELFPEEIDGVPIKVKVVGVIKAL